MIQDHDRVGYIGASDSHYVMMNWNTKTFRAWWDIKMGLADSLVDNIYTRTGTLYEPKILDYLEIKERDRQIIIGRLRVNLDGETDTAVIEIKTFQWMRGLKVPKNIKKWDYWQQVQVEMFAAHKEVALIYAYGLLPSEYGEPQEVEPERLVMKCIPYDEEWMLNEYLPRMNELARCIKTGEEPDESNINKQR